MKKIILVGYMGSGKSTIGKKLASELMLDFIDLDDFIEKQEGTSITEIFKSKGEIYFRKAEHKALHSIVNNKTNFILSLGGGTPCYANNHEVLLHEEITSFYLKGSIATLTQRLTNEKGNRPILNQNSEDSLETFIAKHLFDRSYFYHQAKHIVTIDNKSVSDIVEQIKTML
ncbi:shikimate kinase [Myroides pelagicus]|uniref:Shikimate kinase n=1 Tax=Myroides pelagicus TaxID=270914 RepID=A0A7K1GNR6_9FLAO|nr:shikimate kinase [Myroides pelagicus]MEC4114565.1 shikimate kinase [Myroides pelagicus]MTH30189.1 shikimate kinase [Myroides pelagicus]